MTSPAHEDAAATLVELLRGMAASQPDARVFGALGDTTMDAPHAASVTFAELDREARAIAAALQRAGVAPGERAVLFYPAGVALVPALFGCLYAGVVAVPAPLPGVDSPSGRSPLAGPSHWLLSLLSGCRPAIILSGLAPLCACRAAVAGVEGLDDVPWLVTDAISPASAALWREVTIGPDTPALMPPGAGDSGAVTHARLMGGPAALGLSRATAGWLPILQESGPATPRPGLADTAKGKGRAGSSAA